MEETRRELYIALAALRAFGDRVTLRDPRACSLRPSLVPAVIRKRKSLLVHGDFRMLARYRIAPAQGAEFVHATGDDNPIHLTGDVVPGAMTASKILAPLEVLFPRLAVERLSIRFTAVATYGRSTLATFHVIPGPGDKLRVETTTAQEEQVVAEATVEGEILPNVPAIAVPRRKVNMEALRRVRAYFAALAINPNAYLRKGAVHDYSYPQGFLASLPSGAMVAQLRGAGGIVSKLSVEFDGGRKIPLMGSSPEVSLEQPRVRKTFNKILAFIKEGVTTYMRGSALVLPGETPHPAHLS